MENHIQDIILENSIFKIGNVFSVDGRIVRIKVDKKKNLSHLLYKGVLIKNVSVGSYVKIAKGFIFIIAKVEGEYIKEDRTVDMQYNSYENAIERVLSLKLLGYLSNGIYTKGIKELPLIGNECFLLNNEEFDVIHSFASKEESVIELGKLAFDERQSIRLSVNKLFSSHIGIFGNTGSGKSYTLAKLYRQLFLKFQDKSKFQENAKFILFDFNGEYSADNVVISNKKTYKLNTRAESGIDRIPMSEEDLLRPEIFHIIASASEKTQQPFIDRSLKLYKRVSKSEDPINYFRNSLKKITKLVLVMSDKSKADLLIDYLIQILPKKYDDGVEVSLKSDFNWHAVNHTFYSGIAYFNSNTDAIEHLLIFKQIDEYNFSDNFISRIIQFLYLQLVYDVLGNRAMNEHIAPAINKLRSFQSDFDKVFQISANDFWGEHNYCIIDMNGVNTKMKKLIPLLLSYKLYSEHKMHRNNEVSKYLNIIIDEAHNILSYESQRESESWKDFRLETFEEIIKEGRKFGVFLTIASQRPSDISHTIISQLHNFFIHRLVNNRDLEMVEKSISYLDKLSVESLPILPTGVCALAGVIAEMPIVMQIDMIEAENKPVNETIKLVEVWGD